MSILRIEMYKMFREVTLKIVILISLFIVGMQTYSFYVTQRRAVNESYEAAIKVDNDMDEIDDFFENSFIEGWIGCETYTPYHTMLYLIMPLFAAIPFAISQFEEWRSGYAAQVITRCGRRKYMNAKYAAVFISGGITIAVPLIISMIVSMCYMPVIKMDPIALQSRISTVYMFGYTYIYHPVLYTMIYIFVDFLYGGIFACMAMVASSFVRNRFTAMTFPMALSYFLYYGLGRLSDSAVWLRTYNFSYFIRPDQNGESSLRFVPFISITVALLAIEYFIYWVLNVKRETIKN